MSFSYDATALSQPVNQLRFLVQDTVDAGHFFEDSEITFAVGQSPNIYRVAADLCRAAAAKFASMPGHEGEVVLNAENKSRTYMQLAAKYDDKADAFDKSLHDKGTSGMALPSLSTRDPSFTRDTHFS